MLWSDVGGGAAAAAADDDDDGDAEGAIGEEVGKEGEGERNVSLSWRWPCGECVNSDDRKLPPDGTRSTDVEVAADMDGYSPRWTFSSINLSPTLRPRLMSSLLRFESPDLLLTPLPLRLRGDNLSLPSIMRALGGGCSIHLVSLRRVETLLTTGGWRSLTAGLRE